MSILKVVALPIPCLKSGISVLTVWYITLKPIFQDKKSKINHLETSYGNFSSTLLLPAVLINK